MSTLASAVRKLLEFVGAWIRWMAHAIASNRSARVATMLVAALVVIAVIDTAVNGGRIYNGVHVGEVDLSGMTLEEARAALDDSYGARLASSYVTIYANEDLMARGASGEEFEDLAASEELSVEEAAAAQEAWRADPTALQARIDSKALAQEAYEVGRSNGGLFVRLGAQLFGNEIPVDAQFNERAVETLASTIDGTLGELRVNYGVEVRDGKASVTAGHDGWMIDREWLMTTLKDEFLTEGSDHALVAEISYAPLQIDEAQAQACADLINASIAHGAELNFESTTWSVDAATLGSWIATRVEEDEGGYQLLPHFDPALAKAPLLRHLQPNYDSATMPVEFFNTADSTLVRTNTTGTMPLLPQAIEAMNRDILTGAHDQAPYITVEGTSIPSTMSVEAALEYGIIEAISSYTTEYTSNAEARNFNIHLAADLINDSIAQADGGTWSFNETAGECNAEKGFQGAGVIVNGETVDEIGGGICQVATTVFNAVYEAGFPIVTRSNHSLYIASYPAGRDAAVSWPDLDIVWENDTDSDVLLRSSYTDTTITISLLGQSPHYTVTTDTGAWVEGEPHGQRTEVDATLPASYSYVKQQGADGSSIEVTRSVYDAEGELVRSEVFLSVYAPKDEIIVEGSQ